VWGKGTVIVGLGHDYTTTAGGALLNFSTGLDTWGGGSGSDTWGGGRRRPIRGRVDGP
jgi:hypothetical protein